MTTTSVFRAFASVLAAPATRDAPNLARADIFNRLYIVAMFAIIMAIGSFGIVALAGSQQSSDRVARSFEHANDTSAMLDAVDREYFELHGAMRHARGEMSPRFVQATTSFYTAYFEIERDGWASGEPLLKTLAPHHASFMGDSR